MLDMFGYVPSDVDGAKLPCQVMSESYEWGNVISAANVESAGGARSSPTTSSRPQSWSASCTTAGSSSSAGPATGSRRASCWAGREGRVGSTPVTKPEKSFVREPESNPCSKPKGRLD